MQVEYAKAHKVHKDYSVSAPIESLSENQRESYKWHCYGIMHVRNYVWMDMKKKTFENDIKMEVLTERKKIFAPIFLKVSESFLERQA